MDSTLTTGRKQTLLKDRRTFTPGLAVESFDNPNSTFECTRKGLNAYSYQLRGRRCRTVSLDSRNVHACYWIGFGVTRSPTNRRNPTTISVNSNLFFVLIIGSRWQFVRKNQRLVAPSQVALGLRTTKEGRKLQPLLDRWKTVCAERKNFIPLRSQCLSLCGHAFVSVNSVKWWDFLAWESIRMEMRLPPLDSCHKCSL